VIGDYGRGEKTRELEAAVAVGRDHHGDLDALITQSGDASGPFSFNHGSSSVKNAQAFDR
jgi:predicted metalloprotease